MKKEDKKKMLKGILITVLVMIPISFLMYWDIIFTLWYIPISLIQVSILFFVGMMIEKLIERFKKKQTVSVR